MQYPLVQLAWRRLYQHPLLLVPPVMVTVFSDTLLHFFVPSFTPSVVLGVLFVCGIVSSKWLALVWQTHWIISTYRVRVSIHHWLLVGWFGCLMAGEWVLLLAHFHGRASLGVPFSTVPPLWHLSLPVIAFLLGLQLLVAWFFPLIMVECWHGVALRDALWRVGRYMRALKPWLLTLLTAFVVAFLLMLLTLSLSSLPVLGATIQRVGLGVVMGTWNLIWVVGYCHHRLTLY